MASEEMQRYMRGEITSTEYVECVKTRSRMLVQEIRAS